MAQTPARFFCAEVVTAATRAEERVSTVHQKGQRFWAALLAVILMALSTACQIVAPSPPTVTEPLKVLLLPLDSRPVNTQHVALLARMAGYRLFIPPGEMLDQYLEPGDSARLMEWLSGTLPQVDAAIIVSNGLLSGGLIASRHPRSYSELSQRMQSLSDLLQEHQALDVTLISVLPRQLPTQHGNAGWAYREQLTRYGQLADMAVQSLATTSQLAELTELQQTLPTQILQDYQLVYTASRAICEQLLHLTTSGAVDRLAITLDDAAPFGLANLHQRELMQQAEQLGVQDRVYGLTGADEISMLALARLVLDRSGVSPEFWLHFEQPSDAETVALFESAPLLTAIREKIEFSGAVIGDSQAGNQVFVHARPGDAHAGTVAASVSAQRALGRQTGVIDVALVNQADLVFTAELYRLAGADAIDSYAGWNTASNAIGSVISHLAVRSAIRPQLASLQPSDPELRDRLGADLEYRLLHLLDAAGYQASVRGQLTDWARQMRFPAELIPSYQLQETNAELTRRMQPLIDQWSDIMRGPFTYQLVPGHLTELAVESWECQVQLPWPRLFEVQITPKVHLAP